MMTLPRTNTPRYVRVYRVLAGRVATADELVAVFMDRWPLIGPRVEGDPDAWFRARAVELWPTLTGGQVSESVTWLADLLSGQASESDRSTLRHLELSLASAFGFDTRDQAPRAVAEVAGA
jgi:hypothetical protein